MSPLRLPGRVSGSSLVMVATLACSGLSAVTTTAVTLERGRESVLERDRVQRAIEQQVEALRAASEGYLGDPADWARTLVDAFDGHGTELKDLGPGARLVIEVVTDETLCDAELGTELGLPRDLDGDGVIQSTDVSQEARLLPVVLRVTWEGAAGPRQQVRDLYLVGF